MSDEIERLKEALKNEKKARFQSEKLLGTKSRELFESTRRLQELSSGLEKLVQKRTAELEKARDEALASARSKAEFLANVSHEIRTPMNGILGMIQALKKCKDLNKRERLLRTAEESGRLLVSIIDDVLESSSLENAGLVLDEEPLCLVDTIESMIQNFATTAHAKHLDLVTDISAQIPKMVRGDAVRIKQVIGNLVNNAIKFTEKGEVVVSVGYMGDNEFRFAVQDTGIGMNNEECDKIFAVFSQADTTTTRKYGGTGLGLSISAKIVDAYKSRINVTSKPGEGTRFYFYLHLPIIEKESIASETLGKELKANTIVVSKSESRRSAFEGIFSSVGAECSFSCLDIDALQSAEFEEGKDYSIFIDDFSRTENDENILLELRAKFPGITTVEVASYSKASNKSELIDYIIVKPVHVRDVANVIAGDYESLSADAIGSQAINYDFTGKRLLVVDDNLINLQVAQEIFGDVGFEIELAMSGQEAIEKVEARAFDMVLMDIQMPGMDGLETSKKIRGLGGVCNEIPILAVTAHALNEDREKSLAAGMNEHMTKPIDTDVIFPVMEKYLKSGSSLAKDSAEGRDTTFSSVNAEPLSIAPPEKPNPYSDLAALNIPELEGFDLPNALKRLRGKWHRLKPYIIGFAEENQYADKVLNDLLAAKDYDEASRHTHKIKGSAANIGAVDISATAGSIENLLKSGETTIPKNLLEKFYTDVKILYKSIDVLREDSEDLNGDEEISRKKVADLLNEIGKNLESDLGSVSETIDKLCDVSKGTEHYSLAKNINDAFNKFQLPEIHKIIKDFSVG